LEGIVSDEERLEAVEKMQDALREFRLAFARAIGAQWAAEKLANVLWRISNR